MKQILFILLPLALMGCATSVGKQVLPGSATTSLKQKTLAVTTHQPSPLRFEKAGTTLMLGAFAPTLEYRYGQKLISETAMPDPALAITAALSNNLAATHHMRIISSSLPVYVGDDGKSGMIHKPAAAVPDLLAYYPEGDTLLDVDSFFWGILTSGVNNVLYVVDMRLIDRNSQTVLASDRCQYISSKDEKEIRPTYDQLVANNSAIIQRYYANAAQKCTAQFIDTLNGKEVQ